MSTQCPKCAAIDQIIKVSAIVNSGTSSGTFAGPTGSVSFSKGNTTFNPGFAVLSGTQQTELASLFTPPAEPKRRKPIGCIGYFFIVCILGLLILGFSANASLAEAQSQFGYGDDYAAFAILCAIGFLVIVGWLSYYVPKKTKEFDALYYREMDLWRVAIERWDRLYYCMRDDIVFDPTTNIAFTPQEFYSYLLSNPS
ncbi:MAG: hypothetical protein WHV66_02055 [Anaerolineales bacterium]